MKNHLLLGSILIALFASSPKSTAAAPPALVSHPEFLRTQAASGQSTSPVLSADGSSVVFLSQADDLVTSNHNGMTIDVYVRRLTNNFSELVSVNLGASSGGNGDSLSPSVSSDGSRIAFSSTASDLVPGDTNNASDIFVRDLNTGLTILVSGGLNGAAISRFAPRTPPDGAYRPRISPNGRYVVFESRATNLVEEAVLATTNIYVRDLVTGTTRRLNTNDVATTGYCLPSGNLTDRYVAYATTITPGPGVNPLGNSALYVADLESGSNTIVNLDLTNTFVAGKISFDSVSISTNGQYLAFRANSANGFGIFLHDRMSEITSVLLTNTPASPLQQVGNYTDGFTTLAGPSMSPDGRFVAYARGGISSTGAVWDATLGANIFSTTGDQVQISDDGRYVAWKQGVQVFRADLTTSVTNLLNPSITGGVAATNDLFSLTLSADGQKAAFEAFDGDLVSDDRNRAFDVFVRDANLGTTTLVSQRSPLRTAPADGISSVVTRGISTNGQWALFMSQAENLVANDTNGYRDVFIRDLLAGTNLLVSVATNGFSGSRSSYSPVMSWDARYVAFVSVGSNFVAGDVNNLADVFRRDLLTGETVLVSSTSFPSSAAGSPSMSASGSRVAFERNNQINVWDAASGLLPVNPSATGSRPVIGPNGNLVAYFKGSSATAPIGLWRLTNNAVSTITTTVQSLRGFSPDGVWLLMDGPQIVLFNTTNSTLYTFSNLSSTPGQSSMSVDGRFVAFVSTNAVEVSDTNGMADIYLADRNANQARLVSVDYSGVSSANGPSRDPAISADGRYVAFSSTASNLIPDNTNRLPNLYLRDLKMGTTTLLSATATGGPVVSGASIRPALGLDGRTLVFLSGASDFAPNGGNSSANLFYFRLPPPGITDTDGDHMDDAWEIANFGNLSHDGTADTDGDGQTDLAEYLAGTDPKNASSTLGFTLIQPPAQGTASFKWTTESGRFYRVQYKDSLEASLWTDLPGPISILGQTASFSDTNVAGLPQRFYRVVLQP